ncbi:MAG: oligosaccharide flippase family protein [Firmicutes bacterium]|nr:oligosaccharide flippase family protein [Bacillota bacterium]
MNNHWLGPHTGIKANVALTVCSRILMAGCSLITHIITARFLGPEGRGEFFFVITLAGIFAQFGNFGLHASNTYWVARDSSLLGGLLANSFWLSLLSGGLALGAAGLSQVFHFFPGVPARQLWMAAALAPLTLFYLLGVNLYVGAHRFKAFNFFETANRLAGCAALAMAAWMSGKVFQFLGAFWIAGLMVALLLFISLYRQYGTGLGFNKTLFMKGFYYGLKAYLVGLLGFLITQSSILLLQQLSGSREVGYYSIAFNTGSMLGILPASLALVLFPRLVAENSRGREMTMRNTALMGGLMSVVCLLAFVLAKPLIRIFFGPEFQPAVPVLYWMLPGILLASMVNILSQYLAAKGFPWILAGVWGAGFLLAVGLSLILIPPYYGIGAAISVSATWAFLLAAHFLLVRRESFGRKA